MVTQTADRAEGKADSRGRSRGGVCSRRQNGSEGADGAFSLCCDAIRSVTTQPLVYLQTVLLYDIVNAVYKKMYFYGSCEKKRVHLSGVVYADGQ